MIELTKYEKAWILACKGQLAKQFPFSDSWVKTLEPMFEKIYAWSPNVNNHYYDYLNGLFNKLLEIQLKISDDGSGSNVQLKGVFSAAFNKSISNDAELPIVRSINELCGVIQCNTVIDNGKKRYDLENVDLDFLK